MLQFFIDTLLCKRKSVGKTMTRVLISFPFTLERRHLMSILSYSRLVALIMQEQANCLLWCNALLAVKWELLQYTILFTKPCQQKKATQLKPFSSRHNNQSCTLHSTTLNYKINPKIYLMCCWKNALAERKVTSQLVFPLGSWTSCVYLPTSQPNFILGEDYTE